MRLGKGLLCKLVLFVEESGDAEGMFYDNSLDANGGKTYISEDYDANLEEAKAALAEAGYPDGEGFPTITYSTNGNNDGKYNSKEFDAAMDKSRCADAGDHFAALHEAEKIMMEDYACIPVAYYNDFWLQSPSLKGTWHSPYGYWYFQYGYVEE